MKIYILRHEDRTQDATMFSPLTEVGLKNSLNLVKILEKLKINKIYSSPFIRTLQTIYPYSKEKDIKINIDYSLAEIQIPDLIPKKSYDTSLPEYLKKSFNYDDQYNSVIESTDYKYPESSKDIMKRVKTFLQTILRNHKKHHNIIIVTHQACANCILDIIANTNKTELDSGFDLRYNYPKGGITQIFEGEKWAFKPINWKYD